MKCLNIHAYIAKYGIDIPNSEAGNDEIQNVNMDLYFVGITLNKVVANFQKHIFLSQADLTRTGIISNSYNEMFEA
jgi:hypothetical protein